LASLAFIQSARRFFSTRTKPSPINHSPSSVTVGQSQWKKLAVLSIPQVPSRQASRLLPTRSPDTQPKAPHITSRCRGRRPRDWRLFLFPAEPHEEASTPPPIEVDMCLQRELTDTSNTGRKTPRNKAPFIRSRAATANIGDKVGWVIPSPIRRIPRHGFPLKPTLPASPIFAPPHHDHRRAALSDGN